MKLFGSFGFQATTYLVFFASEPLDVTPTDFVHRICRRVSKFRLLSQAEMMHTSIAQVCRSFIVLFPYVSSNCSGFPALQSFVKLTCLAANLSTGTPQPCRKQFASSKMARTSSPFAAPPFFMPAWRARSSIDAAFDAAADRYLTASVGLGAMPQPWLEIKTSTSLH
jgi:hypothetical protein